MSSHRIHFHMKLRRLRSTLGVNCRVFDGILRNCDYLEMLLFYFYFSCFHLIMNTKIRVIFLEMILDTTLCLLSFNTLFYICSTSRLVTSGIANLKKRKVNWQHYSNSPCLKNLDCQKQWSEQEQFQPTDI